MTAATPSTRPSGRPAARPAAKPKYAGALLRFRIMAFATGTVLVLATFVALPLQWWAGQKLLAEITWIGHGYLYLLYVAATLDLAIKLRWHPVRVLLIMAAGTIPFMSFVAEHYVVKRVRATLESGLAPKQPAPAVAS
ncbi:integral membrane protein [Jatrophihabitans sp. GAS493]|uniref:DUF3817 domain-containing protein n=1 Tax=Jatrophihabitans sp. GAS493 TaxID=1907575 RepID=UPI000BC03BFA|nr:DUF3817 domain-containing protein [Jatrophihabitans sp. GAS493]SOD75085.1 integral membrane protein [Jatrophihabitans sp. GAS493]